MGSVTLFYEDRKYYLGFPLTASTLTKVPLQELPVSDETEFIKKLVEAYKKEKFEIKNGNLEEKLFDYLTL